MTITIQEYEYRFAAVCGLQRRASKWTERREPFSSQMMAEIGPWKPQWEVVDGNRFLEMTWQELEHVAHVIRDASRPSVEAAE